MPRPADEHAIAAMVKGELRRLRAARRSGKIILEFRAMADGREVIYLTRGETDEIRLT